MVQKWYMTNTPPEIDNITPTKNGALQKRYTLGKNAKDRAE